MTPIALDHRSQENMLKTMKHFVLLYKMVYSQNRDSQTYPVTGNDDSYGLASQASAEYAQEDDETFRAAFTKWIPRKIVIQNMSAYGQS
jgi:hypothetical protein